jgi:DNA-directed RNA polymerase subunit RPC12/RpoP/ribosomal protein S27E
MSTGWTIEQACPQCGAQVELDEADRILSCRFCRVRHYLMPRGRFRYALPVAEGVPLENLFYAPYWRFRGMACICRAYDVDYRVVDTSFCGADIAGLPQTLGFRPQAMKLRFVLPEHTGRYLPLKISSKDFAARFADQQMRSTEQVFFRECIGETVSLIYAPFFVKDKKLYDGVLNAPLAPAAEALTAEGFSEERHDAWGVSFLPTLCPNCGWDMLAEKESCVLMCPKCSRAWQPSAGGYAALQYAVMKCSDENAQYIPFWRMTATVEGLKLATQADLVGFANLPRVATAGMAEQPVSFWAPAFKIQPQVFLRLARQVMAQQPGGETHDQLAHLALHPVTLPLREAAESIKLSLALIAAKRTDVYPELSRAKIAVHGYEIVYLPFTQTAHELVHKDLCLAIGRNALHFGRSI